MKKYSYLLFVATLLFSCKKDTPKDLNSSQVFLHSHCVNGILDGDEIDVDCGGTDCTPCKTVASPCTVQEMTLQFAGTTYTFTSNQISTGVSNGHFYLNVDAPTLDLRFTFSEEQINKPFNEFELVNNQFGVTDDQCYLTITKSSGPAQYAAYSGSLYVNKTSTGWSMECCDVYMNNPMVAGYEVIKTNIKS